MLQAAHYLGVTHHHTGLCSLVKDDEGMYMFFILFLSTIFLRLLRSEWEYTVYSYSQYTNYHTYIIYVIPGKYR